AAGGAVDRSEGHRCPGERFPARVVEPGIRRRMRQRRPDGGRADEQLIQFPFVAHRRAEEAQGRIAAAERGDGAVPADGVEPAAVHEQVRVRDPLPLPFAGGRVVDVGMDEPPRFVDVFRREDADVHAELFPGQREQPEIVPFLERPFSVQVKGQYAQCQFRQLVHLPPAGFRTFDFRFTRYVLYWIRRFRDFLRMWGSSNFIGLELASKNQSRAALSTPRSSDSSPSSWPLDFSIRFARRRAVLRTRPNIFLAAFALK